MFIKSVDYFKYIISIIIATTVGKKKMSSLIHLFRPFHVNCGAEGVRPFEGEG